MDIKENDDYFNEEIRGDVIKDEIIQLDIEDKLEFLFLDLWRNWSFKIEIR